MRRDSLRTGSVLAVSRDDDDRTAYRRAVDTLRRTSGAIRMRGPIAVRIVEDPNRRLFNEEGKLVMCSAPPWFDFVIAHPDVVPMIHEGARQIFELGELATTTELAPFSPAGGRAAHNIAACYRPDGVA